MLTRNIPFLVIVGLFGMGLAFLVNILDPFIYTEKVRFLALPALKNTTLSVITIIALIVALVVQPVVGRWSDRTRSRWGQRAPYLTVGVIGVSISLVLIVSADNLWLLIIAAMLTAAFSNTVQGPWQALIPDQVPESQRGTAAGIKTFLEVIGVVAGIVLVGFTLAQGNLWVAPLTAIGLFVAILVVTLFTLWRSEGRQARLLGRRVLSRSKRGPGTKPERSRRAGRLVLPVLSEAEGNEVEESEVEGLEEWQIKRMRTSTNRPDDEEVKEDTYSTVMGGEIHGQGNKNRNGGPLRLSGKFAVSRFITLRPILQVGRVPGFSWWILNRFLFWSAGIAIRTFMLNYLEDVLSFSLAEAQAYSSRLFLWLGIGVFFLALPAGVVADRVGRRPLLLTAGLIAASGAALLIFLRAPNLLFIAGGLIAGGAGIFASTSWASATDLVPETEGALYLGLANGATVVGSIGGRLAGPLIDGLNQVTGTVTVGYLVTFGIAALFFAGSSVVVLKIPEGHR